MDLGFVFLVIVAGIVYFIPALIASNREHPNQLSIFVVNLFAGWTGIGWVTSLVWSLTTTKDVVVINDPAPVAAPKIKQEEAQADTKDCPFCAETIKAKAVFCKHCSKDLETSAA